MERIRGYNYRVYVGIIRERIELYQIGELDTKIGHELYTTQSAEKGYIELLRYLHMRGCEWKSWTLARCKRHVHEQRRKDK